MRNNNLILFGDEIRCDANFYTVDHKSDALSVFGS